MIGKNYISIGAEEFIRGMSSGADIADGGFSPETLAVNLTANPGVLYGPALAVDKSTNLTGEAIAWCPTLTANLNGFLLDNGGKIYSLSTAQVLAASAALAGTFTTGTSDIVQFIDKIYATSSTDVARMDTDLTGGLATWWSVTLAKGVLTSGVRHPLCVFQDRLWVGDKNALHKITNSTTGDKDVLLLTTDKEITALAVDPSSGKMLIAATQGPNYSGTIASGSSIFAYDGTSATYTREYIVDGMVTGFHHVGGITFVAYGGNKIGYWNGAGVIFLRKLKNVTLAGAELPYKHHLSHIDNTLYVVDGRQILAYGEVLPGQKAWYYCYYNGASANKLSLLCPVGDKKLGYAYATSKFFTLDTADITTATDVTFYSNKIVFPRPVFIRGTYLEYADGVTNNGTPASISFKTQDQRLGFVALEAITNSSGVSVYEFNDIKGQLDDKVKMLQVQYVGTLAVGLRRMIIYFDPAE